MLVSYAVAFKCNAYLLDQNPYILEQVEHNPYNCHEGVNGLPCNQCAIKLFQDDEEF